MMNSKGTRIVSKGEGLKYIEYGECKDISTYYQDVNVEDAHIKDNITLEVTTQCKSSGNRQVKVWVIKGIWDHWTKEILMDVECMVKSNRSLTCIRQFVDSWGVDH